MRIGRLIIKVSWIPKCKDCKEKAVNSHGVWHCPKCNNRLSVTEHYFGREAAGSFGLVEHVSLECKNCGLYGKGRNESEALANLKEK